VREQLPDAASAASPAALCPDAGAELSFDTTAELDELDGPLGQARALEARGGTARAAAARAPRPVLLIPRGARVGSRIFAVDDGSPAAARASELARALAASSPPRVVRAEGAALPSVADRIGPHTPALVVLPASGPPTRSGIVERLLTLGIPVLLVR
jgi:hypothetical protein